MDSICPRLFANLGYPAFAKVARRGAEVGRFTPVATGQDRPEAVGRVVQESGPVHLAAELKTFRKAGGNDDSNPL